MNLTTLKNLLEEKNLSYDLNFEIADMLIEARIAKGLKQEDLAHLIDTKQPNIARIENGKSLPSLKTLDRIARALGSYLIAPKFAFLEESKVVATLVHREEFKDKDAMSFSVAPAIVLVGALDNKRTIDWSIDRHQKAII